MVYGDGRFGDEPGAVAWLVGEENRGLQCMFTMMNNARLMIGVQGVGQAERALQQATAFALERRQGRAPGARGEGMSPIVDHPDVRCMLATMRALTEASRAICYDCALAADLGHTEGYADRARQRARAELLTPVAKAFSTDAAFEVASLGVQVHGGMGFIEETGAAQTLRDSRISPIYEGTNGIQAIDLVTRKLPMEGGAIVAGYIKELREIAERARAENRPDFGRMGARLDCRRRATWSAATAHLRRACSPAEERRKRFPAQRPICGCSGLRRAAPISRRALLHRSPSRTLVPCARIATARFFAERLLPETAALKTIVIEGAEAVTRGRRRAFRGECMSLAGKTLFITGASRGIGLAIALRAAQRRRQYRDRRQDDRAASKARRHDLHRGGGDRAGRRQGAAARGRYPRRSGGERGGRPNGGRRSAASTSS